MLSTCDRWRCFASRLWASSISGWPDPASWHGLHEHLAMGLVSLLLLLANAWLARSSGVAWIRSGGTLLAWVVTAQVILGLASWVVKYGHGSYVAVADSIEHVSVRTAHAVVGIITFMCPWSTRLGSAEFIPWPSLLSSSRSLPTSWQECGMSSVPDPGCSAEWDRRSGAARDCQSRAGLYRAQQAQDCSHGAVYRGGRLLRRQPGALESGCCLARCSVWDWSRSRAASSIS